jgi:malonate-semialdehyde dehydrogenase (acetylating)/methylmalonate-semialdehyde dehydrogenase
MVVLPDADIDQASAAAVSAAYGSAGERCMAVSVVVAVGDVADSLVDKIRAGLAEIVVGDGADPDSQMGPLVTLEHRDRVASHIDRARAQGATVTVDGREATSRANDKGFFLGPSLLDDVTPEMDCYREEIFGPVLSIVRVDDLDDAVRLINENPYGNGAALFTRDGAAARRFRYEVEAGMVGINVPIPVPVGYYSFGGWNGSLFGDRGIYGKEGVEFYTRPKVVTSRWPGQAAQPSPGLDFPRTGA